MSKQKDCQLVGEWEKSIINHLYWCVASTPNGESEIIRSKWLSLENHVHNIHDSHGSHFPKCAHSYILEQGSIENGSNTVSIRPFVLLHFFLCTFVLLCKHECSTVHKSKMLNNCNHLCMPFPQTLRQVRSWVH